MPYKDLRQIGLYRSLPVLKSLRSNFPDWPHHHRLSELLKKYSKVYLEKCEEFDSLCQDLENHALAKKNEEIDCQKSYPHVGKTYRKTGLLAPVIEHEIISGLDKHTVSMMKAHALLVGISC